VRADLGFKKEKGLPGRRLPDGGGTRRGGEVGGEVFDLMAERKKSTTRMNPGGGALIQKAQPKKLLLKQKDSNAPPP